MNSEAYRESLDDICDELASGPDLLADPEFVSEFARAQVVNDIYALMKSQHLSKSDLADRLQKSRQYVGQVLNEHANFTIERLAEFACALDAELEVRIESRIRKKVITALEDMWRFSQTKRQSIIISEFVGARNNAGSEKTVTITGLPPIGDQSQSNAA